MQQEADSTKVLKSYSFRIILGIVVMAVIGGSMVAPILPAMIDPLGTSREMIGLVMSVYTLCALISTPIHGVLADRHGRKKVIVPAIILYGISGFSIALVREFHLVLILRGLQGMGAAGMMSLGVTLIGDIFTEKARAVAMGYRSSAQSLVNTGIPFIGGTVATLTWFYPFYIYILALPLALLVALRLNTGETLSKTTLKDYFRSIFLVMKDKKTLWVYLSNLFIFVLLYCLIVYGPILIVEELKLSTMYTGLMLSVGSATAAITASQSGKLFYRFKNYKLITAGFIFCGIGLMLVSLALNFVYLLGCIIIWGIGFGIVFPALNTIVTQLVSSHLRAGIVSGFTTMTYIGQTISPPLFGLILANSSLEGVFQTAAILTLAPIAFTLFMHFVYKKV